jgi:protein O-mannosyl-transferase
MPAVSDRINAAAVNDSRSRTLTLGLSALLVFAGWAAYQNSLSGVFVFDDVPAIRDNATIRTLWPLTIPLSPPQNSGVGGRPIANLSFAINYAIGRTDVRVYHIGNLILHLGSALLLFGIVRRTLRGSAIWVAWTAALMWTVHPLTTAAVSYVSQRTELLMAFFYLLTLFAFVRAVETDRTRWFILSIAACALGMMSKEVMVTAPVLVALYDRTFVAGTFAEAWRRRARYYVALGSTWLLLAYLLTTGLTQRSVGYGLGVSGWQYAATECHAIVLYLKLALWPHPLVFDYGRIYANQIAGAAAIAAVLILAFGLSVRSLLRGSAIGFAVAGFFLLLAPTSSFVPIADQPIAENRVYLPLAVFCVAVVASVHLALRRRSRFVLILVVLALLLQTSFRNRIYRSAIAVWTDASAKRPQNPRAHFNRGVVLLDAGHADAAIASFKRTLQLAPNHAEAHNSLGNALLQLGKIPDAISHYVEAVRLKPGYARAWYNLGAATLRKGDASTAIAHLEACLRLSPEFADAHNALGNAHFERNDPARAIPHYEHALRLDPDLADAHYNCGNALLALGRTDDAVIHFAALVRLKPADAEARNAYGAALLTAGNSGAAIAEFERALSLKPEYADARSNLELARRRQKNAR